MNRDPVRLRKEDNVSPLINLNRKLEAFILSHASFFLSIFIIIGLILFVVLCYAIIGVSATESGTVYNQMRNII